MPLNFTKPVTIDNYSSDVLPGIVAAHIALSQWLSSDVAGTLTGTPIGAIRRQHGSSGAVERFNGSAWVGVPINGLSWDGTVLSAAAPLALGDQLRFAAGSAAAPSLAPSGDLNTGFYSGGADVLAFASNGLLRAKFGAAGFSFGGGSTDITANTWGLIDRLGSSPLPTLTAGTVLTLAGSTSSSAAAYLQLISGNAGLTDIRFGDTDAALRGALSYDHATDSMRVLTAGSVRWTWASNGDVTATGAVDFGTSGLGVLRGVANLAGYADNGAYSMWGGRSTLNGGYVQVYGGSHGSAPSQVIFGRDGVSSGRFDQLGRLLVGVSSSMYPSGGANRGNIEVNGTVESIFAMGRNGAGSAYLFSSASGLYLQQVQGLPLFLGANNAVHFQITPAGALIEHLTGRELGTKDLGQRVLAVDGAVTVADRGSCIRADGGCTNIAINAGVMPANSIVTIASNNPGSLVNLVQGSGMNLRWGQGGAVVTGSRQLAYNGVLTIIFLDSSNAIILGVGLS